MSFAATAAVIGGVASIAGGVFGAISAGKAKREAEKKEREARKEMNRLKEVYSNLDTSNPYLNMENVMEDLTVNQKQAQFQAQQFSQSQANILDTMRGAAGGSGIAATAQALAGQGQLAAQQASVSIGQQEAANQRSERAMAGQLQAKEREGEVWSRGQEKEKQSTLLGMAQSETAAYGQQAQQAQQAKWDAISGGISGLTSSISSFAGAGGFTKKAPTVTSETIPPLSTNQTLQDENFAISQGWSNFP